MAEKVKAQKLEELFATRAGVESPTKDVSLADFRDLYLSYRRKMKSQGTVKNFDTTTLNDFLATIGNKSMGQITAKDVEVYEGTLKVYKTNTIRIRLRTLRTALNWAKSNNYTKNAPKIAVAPPEKVGRALSDHEINLLLKHVSPSYKNMVVFALHTGLRRGELISLDWGRVRQSTDGEWEAEIGGVGGPETKTRRSRVVPLHRVAVNAMGPKRASGRVFKALGEKVSHAVEEASKRAGLGRVRCHDLRHTWATRFMQATGDLFALMQVGGWSDMGSVKIYQHHTRARALGIHKISFGFPHMSPPKSGD